MNLCNAARRFGWDIWPWMETAPKPRLRSVMLRWRHVSQVRTKTMALEPESSLSTNTACVSLNFCGQKMYCCRSVFTVVYLVATSTCSAAAEWCV